MLLHKDTHFKAIRLGHASQSIYQTQTLSSLSSRSIWWNGTNLRSVVMMMWLVSESPQVLRQSVQVRQEKFYEYWQLYSITEEKHNFSPFLFSFGNRNFRKRFFEKARVKWWNDKHLRLDFLSRNGSFRTHQKTSGPYALQFLGVIFEEHNTQKAGQIINKKM